MPYSVASYADVGGSPFQQYLNQQQQNYFQQQQLNNQQQYLKQQQGQQGQQQNPAFGGQNPQLPGLGQQQYGQQPKYGPQQPGQYNPLPTYNQGSNLTRMANGGGYGAPQPTAPGLNPDGSPMRLPPGASGGSLAGDTINHVWENGGWQLQPPQGSQNYNTGGPSLPPTQPTGRGGPRSYQPLQQYGNPAGGTMNNFQYY